MDAEIISVGTELLLGHTVNTDAATVARELSRLGINLLYTCTVGDNPSRLYDTLKQAFQRSDLVITTGGLGPTEDDLTKETIARAAGKKLVLHEASMDRIRQYFAGRSFGETQKKQAYLPEGGTVFPNDVGTAPGSAFEAENGTLVIMLPGPPSELGPMMQHYVTPYLLAREKAAIVSYNIRVFGTGEGAIAEMISDFVQGENPTVATYAKESEMFVRVTAKAATKEEAAALCEPLVVQIKDRIGDTVYGVNIESLEELVVSLLRERNLHLATAESCTGGLLAKRITDIPGSSEVFEMGAVTYANRIKTQVLGVPAEMLQKYGAVSEQVARAMAEGIRRSSGSDLGIGITGIAGPGGGTAEKPVGLVYLALSDGKQTIIRKLPGTGHVRSRAYLRGFAASHALDMVRRYLLKLPVIEDVQIRA